MNEPSGFSRRDFLKLAGIGVAAAAGGCAPPATERLIPYLVPPADVLPGVPYWYASTCTECPAGCGILVKQREGRVVKIEGNPEHPLNRGGLCARGQAGLQGLYNPDRVRAPMVREGNTWKTVSWDEGLRLASERISGARSRQKGVALVTSHAPGSFEALCRAWAQALGASYLAFEPFSMQAIREANQRTYGVAAVPIPDLSRARFLVSFGADFLETWGVPVTHAREFAAMREHRDGGTFVAVEPRMSLTGANADEWIAVRPGGEMAVALGMAHVIVNEGLAASGGGLADVLTPWSPDAVQQQTDVPADTIRSLARRFAAQRPSLALAGGIAAQSEQAVATIAAINLLNHVAGNVGETVRFDRVMNDDAVTPFGEMQRLAKAMDGGEVEVFVVHGANPVYAAPAWSGFGAGLAKVPFKLSLSSVLDETTAQCDLVLPSMHALETLGDANSVRGVYSLMQPTMTRVPMFDARPAGDTLIALARGAGVAGLPASWVDHVQATWRGLHARFGQGADWDKFWNDALRRGGVWETTTAATPGWSGAPVFASPELRGAGDVALVLYPSPALYDGRGADKPWLQELPDPTTKVVWGSWAELHPETAERLGVKTGEMVKVETEAGSVTVPAYLYPGIRKDTVAIPLGQGHTSYGRYAEARGVNAIALLAPAQDAVSGSVAYLSTKARVSRVDGGYQIAMTQREKHQADRELARIIPLAALAATGSAGQATHGTAGHTGHGGHPVHPSQTRLGKHTEPRLTPPGYEPPAHAVSPAEPEMAARGPRQIPVDRDSYSPRKATHRWAMAIDLDRCTGCSACVVACNAENNIPHVGPDLVRRGREMMWLRIERFEERVGGNNDVRFLPMLCQHCSDAPCETVCPVYATYHNPEGLNAQIYNRCVGTRYCSNNCPYKVRSFNFFDYSAPEKETFSFPEPLNWQLNPDVTVRSKGVMEKCTFCVQRILEGKGTARDESRPLRDLEIQTACQQSCPSQAIVFGDLLDPTSRVAQLSKQGERRYWALNDLNTKPAITYLKKVERAAEAAPQVGHG